MKMLFEPIDLDLDRKRKFKLDLEALENAETQINRRRGVAPTERIGIDFLIFDSARKTSGLPLDLVIVLLWAGLIAEDPALTLDQIRPLMEASPLTRGQIVTKIWDHYIEVTSKDQVTGKTKDESDAGDGEKRPLALRPGSTSGPLQ
jgi:hypothetical protein